MQAFAITFDKDNHPHTGLHAIDTGVNHKPYYQQFNEIIGCQTGDIVTVDIQGKEYDLWIDDEGKFAEDWLLRASRPLTDTEGRLYDLITGGYIVLKLDEDKDPDDEVSCEYRSLEEDELRDVGQDVRESYRLAQAASAQIRMRSIGA